MKAKEPYSETDVEEHKNKEIPKESLEDLDTRETKFVIALGDERQAYPRVVWKLASCSLLTPTPNLPSQELDGGYL